MSLLAFLSDNLMFHSSELKKFISTAPHRYKHYPIPKRSGNGFRIISQPSKELKFIQKILVEHLEEVVIIHHKALAYRKGLSIKDNALLHKANPYLLKMDFKDFFPSIVPELFFDALLKQDIHFSKQDYALLQKVFFMKKTRKSPFILSIGAPSSPLISNAVMFEFDKQIDELCQKRNITYSRYADDLVFSSKIDGALFDLPKLVEGVLDKDYFGLIRINKDKTVFSSKAHNRHITGVTITNDNKLSIGRDKKRLLSSKVHRYSLNQLEAELAAKLSGEISFAIFIEPSFKAFLIRKYGRDVVESLLRFNFENTPEL
ncbi:retron St85 family RNA-directed DNA polymerase [Hydrogenovibrio sp. JE_KL2]|uniref:retron St85 family RNA-directed DNA polymerase n=1 Tax=Hydrogenovibrio sp. JE_KL2 TaxID=2651188 RepID=UPI00128B36F0|nr:retron St85 family RNA-directed DNA polymerase [Hydrogenovibrio sp. JE_KL2]MPQ77561.1 RNA-directed DNA polymerase [Hydrogenovibrio sp. JE_KL2]